MDSIDSNDIWERIKAELIEKLPESALPWIYPLELSGYDKGVLTVVTGQSIGKNILKKNHYSQIVDIIKKISGEPNADFIIIFDENAAKSLKKENEKIRKKAAEAVLKEQAMENLSYMQSASNLNLKYKFENFVVGSSNKFAHDVALSVAKEPAKKYNPLFIYGKAGLGKTHLMQAIGHYVIFNDSKMKVKYTKTEDYVNDYISHSRNSKSSAENMPKFNKKYANIDIILIDDIQFIESKTKSMMSMQYTFDTLYNKGKQIVITSDRIPKDIPTLTEALCSRFEMGLMVELTPPDAQTRVDILKKLAENCTLEYDSECLNYIAEKFTKNVRELEGAFNRVCAYAELEGKKLDKNLAKKVLGFADDDEEIDFEKITRAVADYYETDYSDIMGAARGQKISVARHLAAYLCRELTGKSFVCIGKFYNKKHTTITYAYDKIKKEITSNKELSCASREIRQALRVI